MSQPPASTDPALSSTGTGSSKGARQLILPTDGGRRFPRSISEPTAPDTGSIKQVQIKPAAGHQPTSSHATARPCKEHSFLTDVADVRAMEQGLLQLLDDFHVGKLQAFGGECTFEQMDMIRDQQEKLAKQHFDLDLQHDLIRVDSEESRKNATVSLRKLINQLEPLREAIQSLNKQDDKLQ